MPLPRMCLLFLPPLPGLSLSLSLLSPCSPLPLFFFFFFFCSKLNNNNLTTLPHNVFAGLTRLRTLRLSENLLACDCHLSWLSRFLRGAPRLAPYARCQSPSHLKGQNVANLHVQEFKCSGKCKTNECWTPECWLSVVGEGGGGGRMKMDTRETVADTAMTMRTTMTMIILHN